MKSEYIRIFGTLSGLYSCHIFSDAKLGDVCRRSLQCQISAGPLAICNGYMTDGICVCNSTISHEVAGECYETKYLNEYCRVDQNCLLPENPIGEDRLGLCYYGVCSCRIGKRPAKNNRSCIENRMMDQKCENDIQCQMTENAVCRTICLCETGFTRSKDGKQCLRAALKFGEPCIENEQCSRYLENGVCKKNVCTCPDKYHGYETRCRKDVKPDEPCFDDAECVISKDLLNKVNCTKGICTCTYGKSYDDNFCLSDAPYSTDHQNGLLALSFLIAVFINFI
ncbi:hypothetical protein WA026_018125 [Henosepilachna vigintioctopunctata]|uniref:EB domain-containing protein n=1 Tax=Henosepilachna vigintioctopunctata TaxID=420089 RepID=A0AAW1UM97_9CUCU